MMKVQSGSRSMAHNLDDLYERWSYRHGINFSKTVGGMGVNKEFATPSRLHISMPQTLDECQSLRDQLALRKSTVTAFLTAKKKGELRRIWSAEVAYYDACLAWIKPILREFRDESCAHVPVLELITALSAKIADLEARIAALEATNETL